MALAEQSDYGDSFDKYSISSCYGSRSTMQITHVQVTQYRRSAGGGSDYSAEIQIVEVTTDAGITGVGFASAPLKCGDIVKHMVGNLIAPVLLGKNPFQTTDIWQTLYWEAAPRRGGDGMMRV
ncbi:MAG: hypothetical protein OEM91_16040, partial [Hyphomicrobiales bacterium]|nr:hypothetical protein [Hyphomicrobiales bacterium]